MRDEFRERSEQMWKNQGDRICSNLRCSARVTTTAMVAPYSIANVEVPLCQTCASMVSVTEHVVTKLRDEAGYIDPPSEAAGCVPCLWCGGFREPGSSCANAACEAGVLWEQAKAMKSRADGLSAALKSAMPVIEQIMRKRYDEYVGEDVIEYLREHGKLVLDDNGKERPLIVAWKALDTALRS